MDNNSILRSIRFLLNIKDSKIVEILQLTEYEVSLNEVQKILKNDDELDFAVCPDGLIISFLDGLILFNRGRDANKIQIAAEQTMTNNLALKKLKIAFALKEDDMHIVLEKGGYKMGRAELSAFLRKTDHPNYRNCGDQVLRYFLKGLTQHLRA